MGQCQRKANCDLKTSSHRSVIVLTFFFDRTIDSCSSINPPTRRPYHRLIHSLKQWFFRMARPVTASITLRRLLRHPASRRNSSLSGDTTIQSTGRPFRMPFVVSDIVYCWITPSEKVKCFKLKLSVPLKIHSSHLTNFQFGMV